MSGLRNCAPPAGRTLAVLGLSLLLVLVLLVLVMARALPATAQENGGGKEVVVEGGSEVVRPPRDAGLPILRGSGFQPGARTVIDLSKYKDSQQTVAEVLREVPGVTVISSGDALAPTKVSIRGSRPDQVLIQVDGVTVNTATNNPSSGRSGGRQGFDLSTLPLERVESIEVIRGAASGIYGPEAAAGALIIRTRRPRRSQLMLERTVGAGGFRESEVEWVQPFAESTFILNANHRESRGEYLFFDPTLDEGGATSSAEAEACAPDQGGGLRLRKCNAREVGTLALGLDRGAHQRWNAEFQRSEREGLGGVLNARPHGRELEDRFILSYADGWPFRQEDLLGVKLNTLQVRGERTENFTSTNEALGNAHREQQATGELWYDNWIESQQIRYGGAVHRQKLEDRNFSASRDRQSAYIHWNWHQERGTLEAALRHDSFSDVEGQGTYRVGVSKFLTRRFGAKASRGTGYRPPTLYELFDPGSPAGASVANPDLVPETSVSNDGGLFFESTEQIYAEVLYFEQNVRQDIVAIADPDNTSLFTFQNVFRTRTTGWEAALNIRFENGLGLDASWTKMKALILENDQDDGRDNGNQVPGVAERLGSAAASWRRNYWRLYLNARYSDRRFIDTANSRFLRSYMVVDAGWGFPLRHGFSGSLEGKNLTNETYAELENFPPPGRQLFFTLRWRFPPSSPAKPEGKKGRIGGKARLP